MTPIDSALRWRLVLETQIAIDQYRTLSILILMLGVLICVASIREETQKNTINLSIFLVLSLLIARVITFSTGSITNLLIIETVVESFALAILFWALKAR
jgi:hypothetical protein